MRFRATYSVAMATVVFVIAVLASSASAAAPSLRVSGNQLVDTTTNTAFVPRGVNWPSFEYACVQGWDYSQQANEQHVGPDAAGAALIASWHINTVRIPLNQDCWLGDDATLGEPDIYGTAEGYRQAVQNWVNLLHNEGIAVILDLHWSGPNGVLAEGGQRAMPDDRSDEFWASVAARFKDDRAMIFDAFNEPYSRTYGGANFDLTWDCWLNGGCHAPRHHQNQPSDGSTFTTVGMQALVSAIRGAGATQPIMLPGLDYANDLSQWLAHRPQDGAAGTADDQLVASFHNYNIQTCNNVACWDQVIAPIAAQVPVVAGEFGTDDCKEDHLIRWMDWADARGVGYLMWAWWSLSFLPGCGEHVILADNTGTPRFPHGTALKTRLAALAATPPTQPDPDPPPGDRSAPETTKAGGPKGRTRARRVTFSFTSEPGAAFVCRLDKKPFRACTSPVTKRVRPGRHTFVAAAVDAAGNFDVSPATWAFKVRR